MFSKGLDGKACVAASNSMPRSKKMFLICVRHILRCCDRHNLFPQRMLSTELNGERFASKTMFPYLTKF